MTHTSGSGCCGGTQRGARKPEPSPALEILVERFARGEIDKAEFGEKRQIIAQLREEISPYAAGDTKRCCC